MEKNCSNNNKMKLSYRKLTNMHMKKKIYLNRDTFMKKV